MQALATLRAAVGLATLAFGGCSPELTAPRESTRMTGSVTSDTESPVHVVVTERCSKRLYLFERCPGNFVGDTRLGKPGKFLIEVDTEATDLVMFAYQGSPGSEKVCSVTLLDPANMPSPLDVRLEEGNCRDKFQALKSANSSS